MQVPPGRCRSPVRTSKESQAIFSYLDTKHFHGRGKFQTGLRELNVCLKGVENTAGGQNNRRKGPATRCTRSEMPGKHEDDGTSAHCPLHTSCGPCLKTTVQRMEVKLHHSGGRSHSVSQSHLMPQLHPLTPSAWDSTLCQAETLHPQCICASASLFLLPTTPFLVALHLLRIAL